MSENTIPIMLNDILRIDRNSDDFKYGKITFNVGYNNVRHIDSWLSMAGSSDVERCSFALWPYDTSKKPNRILTEGVINIITAQLESRDEWLLLCVARITKVNDYVNDPSIPYMPCEAEPIEEYRKYFGRVIIKLKKARGTQGYNFTVRNFLDKCEVVRILEHEYGGKPFPGFNKLHEKMRDLVNYTTNTNLGEDWKIKLSSVKAVYCLNNHDEKKVYIGSAYNNSNCLLQRWQDYFDGYHGGNVELKKLFKNHECDPDYFLDNFYFSILETFSPDVPKDIIVEREHHWMDVFNSHNAGYNKN